MNLAGANAGSSSTKALPPRLFVEHLSPTCRRFTLSATPSSSASLLALLALPVAILAASGNHLPGLFLSAVVVLAWLLREGMRVREESVLLLPPLGVQLSATRRLGSSDRFIPMSRIQDVFIHEAIERWSINFYLAITVDPSRGGTLGDDTGMEVVQVFQHIRPRLAYLLPVWKSMRQSLFEEPNSDEETD